MRTVTIDVETAPNTAHTWSLWNVNVGLNQLMESGRILCFAAKWHDQKKPIFAAEWTDGREGMLRAAYDIFNEADAVIGFNHISFDIPWLGGEWARLGWAPPAPYAPIDLKRVAKSEFRMPSNRLEYLAREFLGDTKLKTGGHDLWVQVLQGDPKAQATMRTYNIKDVLLTERLFERLKPWIRNLPNPALYQPTSDQHTCPQCASTNLTLEGRAYTALGAYQRFHCRDCGRWSRGGKRLNGAELR